MNKNNAGFMVFLGIAVAMAIGAFFLAPKMFKTNPELASESAPKTNMVDATAPSRDTETGKAGQSLPLESTTSESGSGEAQDPATAARGWVMPSFDLLRVEPDGSTVIAGKAEPGSTLDVMNGETVIATTKVGPSGDFAVVLDTPLPAGDYQLTLRITGTDGKVLRSEEVATVSVPETSDGELLAMVSKPGKASRIITQPAAAAGDDNVEMAAAASVSEEPKPEEAAMDKQAADASAAAEGAPAAEVAVAAGTEASTQTQGAAAPDAAAESTMETAEAAAADDAAPANAETPALPEASSLLTTSAPQIASETETQATAEAAPSPETVAETEVDVAMAAPEAASETKGSAAVPADAHVRVDAVEIEGSQIFIAGSATPGSGVRVAADGKVIGTAKADESGRFIVEATSELSVGDHSIDADLLDEAGENVVLRATVPFNRPEGEALAAVAPAAPAEPAVSSGAETAEAGQAVDASAPAEPFVQDIASLSKMREDAFEALSTLKQMASSSSEPAEPTELTAALKETVDKLKSAAMAELPADSSEEAKAIAKSMRIQAKAALAALMPRPANDTGDAGVPADAGQEARMIDGLVTGDLSRMNDLLSNAEAALAEPADMAMANTAGADEAVAGSAQSGEPKTILQAPLASTPGAVIIRRGDTLWQISRRTYGEGVRYTTIYVANKSQIQNPDRIKPGQVFSVPENPLENAEEMHKQLLREGKRR